MPAQPKPMFSKNTERILTSLAEWTDCLNLHPPGSAEHLLGLVVGAVLGAAGEAEQKGDVGVLNSLMGHIAEWARKRNLPDGRNIGEVVSRIMAQMTGQNN